jgi:hypothetical protein
MGDGLKVDHSVSISGLKSVGQAGCIKSYRLSANGSSAGHQRRLVTERILMLCFGGRTSEVIPLQSAGKW